MQVSQTADHITHAVIGQQEVVSMGMSDSAALMHILSATLYTFPDPAMGSTGSMEVASTGSGTLTVTL